MSAPEPARSNSSKASFTSASLCGRHKKMGDGVRRASHVAGRVGRSEPGGLARPGGCDDGPRARGSIASTHSGGRADARTRGARTVMAAGAVSLEEFARSAGKERWSETGSRDSSGKSCRHTEGALRFGTPREIGRGNLIISIAVMKKALEIAILGRLCCCSPSRNTAVAAVAAAVRAVVRRVTHRNRAKQAAHTQSNVPRCWTRSSPRAS